MQVLRIYSQLSLSQLSTFRSSPEKLMPTKKTVLEDALYDAAYSRFLIYSIALVDGSVKRRDEGVKQV